MHSARKTALVLTPLALTALAALGLAAVPAAHAAGMTVYVAGSAGEFGTLNLTDGTFSSTKDSSGNNTVLGLTPNALGFSGSTLYALSPTYHFMAPSTTTDVDTINTTTGYEAYSRTLSGPQVDLGTAANGTFYALSNDASPAFLTINPQTGEEANLGTTLPSGYTLDGVLGVVGTSVYAAAYDLDLSNYDELFSFDIGTGAISDVGSTGTADTFSLASGVSDGSTLYGFGNDGNIYTFDTSTDANAGAATPTGVAYKLPDGDTITAAGEGPAPASPAPEPSQYGMLALMGLGLGGLLLRARRQPKAE